MPRAKPVAYLYRAAHELPQQIGEIHPISSTTSTGSRAPPRSWQPSTQAPIRPLPHWPPPAPKCPTPAPSQGTQGLRLGGRVHAGRRCPPRIGQVVSYDASLQQCGRSTSQHAPQPRSPITFRADDMARHGPPNTTCPPQPGTSEHTIAAYLRGRAPGPAWFASAPMISPYRRRLWAKLSTNSDFAICRGERGDVRYTRCARARRESRCIP
jgi:hypothetical protein